MLGSRPVPNITQSLQGLVPGLNITQNNGGEIGTSPGINIRGLATIGQGSNGSPLILIDGMEADIATLNPNDIQSISVLKDAAASSIYGSRAPFGVILITTKQGSSGKVVVNYSNNLRWNEPLAIPKMADSYSFALYMNDMLTNVGKNPWFNEDHLQRIQDYMAGKLGNKITVPDPNRPGEWGSFDFSNDNIDWYKAIYKTGVFSHEHSLNISGGNEKNTYYISGNYLDQNGLLKIGEDGLKRYSVASKISANIASWAKVDYNGRFVRLNTYRPETYRGQHDFWFAEQAWPTLPLRDPNGYYYHAPSAALTMAEGGTNEFVSDRNYQQLGLTLEPAVKDFKIIGNINYSITNDSRKATVNKLYNHKVDGSLSLVRGDNSISEYNKRL